MKIILKCTAVLAIVTSVLMALVTTAYVIKIKISSDTVPSFAGYKPLVVLTGSMKPNLKPGDMIFVKYININDVNVEDIITYSIDRNTYITHRVKQKTSKDGKVILKTQGDANDVEDDLGINGDMIIGKVNIILPKAGYVIQFAKSLKGFVLLVMVPLFILLAEQILKKNSKPQRNKNKRYRRRNNFHAY